MADVALMVVGAVCLLVGFVGCVVPVLPGVACAYAALSRVCHFVDSTRRGTHK